MDKLVFRTDQVDTVLDLQGLAAEAALREVEALLQAPSATGSYLIRFDGAAHDGRETLFQPLGRRLLEARRAGRLKRCLPTADGAAYFIAFAD